MDTNHEEEIDAAVLLVRMRTILELAKLLRTSMTSDDAELPDAADGAGAPPLIFTLGVMTQSPLLEFESSAFLVAPGEDEETNPGIYGKALAQWLAEQLRAAGFSVGGRNRGRLRLVCSSCIRTPLALCRLRKHRGNARPVARVRLRRRRSDGPVAGEGQESRVFGRPPIILNLREEA